MRISHHWAELVDRRRNHRLDIVFFRYVRSNVADFLTKVFDQARSFIVLQIGRNY
jgi:hypothetical protein